MQEEIAMTVDDRVGDHHVPNGVTANGIIKTEIPPDLLENELPFVYDGQIPLGELLSRVMQTSYNELAELAETLPNMSDAARKRTMADWSVKIKKQVVKLYAAAKWARDSETVQKCMNVTAFLMNQNRQFEDVVNHLNYAKDSLDPARLRNHDLLTSLDVLSTGSYRRLPTAIKKYIIPSEPLSDAQVVKTLLDMESAIRSRLRLSEIIPVEMCRYRIAEGRVYFTVPSLFQTSVCLRGADKDDGWFFVHVEFLISVGGDITSTQDFPRLPGGPLQRHIADEADARLAFYLPMPQSDQQQSANPVPQHKLPDDVEDAPLIRLYNFLQIMSLSYQLEILWFQAERMRSLGWADSLRIIMGSDRKKLTVTYWNRQPPSTRSRTSKLALFGGTITVAIVESASQKNSGPKRKPKSRILAELQQKSKLGNKRPSNEVEGLEFQVQWEPSRGAFGVDIPLEGYDIAPELLRVDSGNLNFESLLDNVLDLHSKAIISTFHALFLGSRSVFSAPDVVTVIEPKALHVHLCASENITISIDPRTGRLNLRDTGDLGAVGKASRFSRNTDSVNDDPTHLFDVLLKLRLQTIVDLVEQKANYLGLQSYRHRNFPENEKAKLGASARAYLYIQLENFPAHYLVIVVTDQEFRYALITVSALRETTFQNMVMDDIAWLDFSRIHSDEITVTARAEPNEPHAGMKRKRSGEGPQKSNNLQETFDLETSVLKELYSYCCARVAHMNVERQLKSRHINYTHVNPSSQTAFSELSHIHSSLARSVPALCVSSKDILSGAPAAEAAMPNIRVIPLNWWSDKSAQVVTCVKLKYVQRPVGKRAGSSNIIRPSKRIIYDTREAVVFFVSENVNGCVDEFLEEWARVSKMVVIAREIAQMSKHQQFHHVRLLSFDLQTVEFAYAPSYSVSISCEDQLSDKGGNFDLHFSRCHTNDESGDVDMSWDEYNPHDEAEPYLRMILRQINGRLAPSLHRLVSILRDTLPIIVVLEDIRKNDEARGKSTDTFAKSAGWYRLLYNDMKHALDFRLMANRRVAIVDGSYNMYTNQDGSTMDVDKGTSINHGGLQAIPQFNKALVDALSDQSIRNSSSLRQAHVDVGLVCDVDAVGVLATAIHKAVSRLV